MNVNIVRAKQDHIPKMLKVLRKREHDAIATPEAVGYLKQALSHCVEAWTGYIDDKIVCMWGIDRGSMLTNSAFIWLVTCQGVDEHAFIFVRHSQRRLDDLRKRYSYIHGVVQADNEQSVRWLRWLGFQLGDAEFVNGYALRKFSLVS